MPTASTSQMLGNQVFRAVHKLLRDLVDLSLWDGNMKNMIIAHNGSVRSIPNIPDHITVIYKTVCVWEISQKALDLAADRGTLSELECASECADEYALLWMEEGIEDRDVLFGHKAGGSGDTVHG
ncbi:ribonucleotide-diphosphate reductase subunit rnr1 [Marasmius crinis-equi]|uniref:Ribonucleotide-diphosphate reductase subunit rnr1 n=1 Tax=Marasmius crinis-equi TaxID=585013 RepID=A0ABR3F5E0_9AGAR